MSAVHTFFKWIMRAGLLAIMILLLAWAEMRISRAYHLRAAQQPPSAFIVENSPLIALIHTRIIDGTASPAIEDQTVIMERHIRGRRQSLPAAEAGTASHRRAEQETLPCLEIE